MEKWRVMLCAGNSELGEVDIKRGIFQEDSLSPLVFVLALIPLSLILRKAKAAHDFLNKYIFSVKTKEWSSV